MTNIRPKEVAWKTQDILMVIPKIEQMLDSCKNKSIKYRSLSETYGVIQPVSPSVKTKRKPWENRQVLFNLSGQFDAFNRGRFYPKKSFQVDQSIQNDMKLGELKFNSPAAKNMQFTKNVREDANKSIRAGSSLQYTRKDRNANFVKIKISPATGKEVSNFKYKRNFKSPMKDQSVGNEMVFSQISEVFSQISL